MLLLQFFKNKLVYDANNVNELETEVLVEIDSQKYSKIRLSLKPQRHLGLCFQRKEISYQ